MANISRMTITVTRLVPFNVQVVVELTQSPAGVGWEKAAWTFAGLN